MDKEKRSIIYGLLQLERLYVLARNFISPVGLARTKSAERENRTRSCWPTNGTNPPSMSRATARISIVRVPFDLSSFRPPRSHRSF